MSHRFRTLRWAWLPLLVAGLPSACGPAGGDRPHVLLVTLDTTRADRLGCYGFEGDNSPRLDRLCEQSLVFTRARSSSSWTLPAHASLLTGRFTSSHGARVTADGPIRLTDMISAPEGWQRLRARGLGQGAVTLASVLREHGWATGAVVAGPWLKRVIGIDAGFDHWDDADIGSVQGRTAPGVTDAALRWIREQRGHPFFLFVNYFDPHGPYDAPEAFLAEVPARERGPGVPPRGYDAEIRFMDHHLGRLLDGLAEAGLYDDTWIIVTGDHGELFDEHGLTGHGVSLHEGLLRIPLVMKYPRGRGERGRRDAPVQLVDVLPTVLSELGLAVPLDVQGSPVGRLGHPVVAEVYPHPEMENADGPVQAIVDGSDKLVRRSRGRVELYDVDADPGETTDLAGRHGARAQELESRLDAYLRSLPPPAPDAGVRQVDGQTREALRNLGYLE